MAKLSLPAFPMSFFKIAIIAAVILFLLLFGRQFIYVFERVDPQEVGVQFRSGKIENVVGPGVYNDIGLFVELKRVSSQAIPLNVRDEEIVTKDKQRIGLVVTGDAFRPGLDRLDVLKAKWPQYSTLYLNDNIALERLQSLAKQAMKVCVGDRLFNDAIIGSARDTLRACIDKELSTLAESYGLQITNVVVPEVVLSPEVKRALDSIVQSRLETEKAAQDKLRADAQALAEQARQEGEIRVQQSRIQEEAKQKTTLAQLEHERLKAQHAVIEAQKENDLFSAQKDLEINRALAVAAVEKSKVELATQITLVDLYSKNPDYLRLQMVQANASALQPTDKLIFAPEGTTPTIVLPGPGITPTVDAKPKTAQ